MSVYIIDEVDGPYFKIGRSTRPRRRIVDLQMGNPHYRLEVIREYNWGLGGGISDQKYEAMLKERYAEWWVTGEWYRKEAWGREPLPSEGNLLEEWQSERRLEISSETVEALRADGWVVEE